MATLRTAVIFLLREFVELIGTKYVYYVNHAAKEKDAVVRRVLQEEKERYGTKLAKAKWYLERLEAGKK